MLIVQRLQNSIQQSATLGGFPNRGYDPLPTAVDRKSPAKDKDYAMEHYYFTASRPGALRHRPFSNWKPSVNALPHPLPTPLISDKIDSRRTQIATEKIRIMRRNSMAPALLLPRRRTSQLETVVQSKHCNLSRAMKP